MADSRLRAAVLLTASSIVYLISAIDECAEKKNDCSNERAWAVVFALVGLVVILTVMIARMVSGPDAFVNVEGGISLFLFLWWLVGACLGTFKGPFEGTGNGYFSAWASFIFAAMYSYECSSYMRGVINKGVNAVSARTEGQTGGGDMGQTPASTDDYTGNATSVV